MAVTTPDIVQQRIRALKDSTGYPYRKLALLDDFRPIPAGTLCAICKGRPIPKRWRARLGLAAEGVVYVMTGGTIPPGAQVIEASRCECGQWFISNHPARRRCFICSPFKHKAK